MKGTGEQHKYIERRQVEERYFQVEGNLYSTFLKQKRRELPGLNRLKMPKNWDGYVRQYSREDQRG